ncbi:hypothetical protein QWJ90_05575 [Microbacterium oryzae]|uniref:hypothetical protein n=1 Tax=Microbacterium oryzae TaxID=743009 RepID=UPI0025B0D97D|nr:hypothetical protein [Microbacterium oryzae]MDN3310391.1 hypothetical protein [Microbacterium oryzae]
MLAQLNDVNSVANGLVSTALTAGLTLIDPRRLTVGRRAAYRGVVAVLTAWVTWTALRSDEVTVPPAARAGIVTGAAGAVLGFAELGEALDARLHDGLARAGAARPRLWLAAAAAVLSLVSWWGGRTADRKRAGGLEEL